MRCLVAFDKFKDCLTAREVCGIARNVLKEELPGAGVTEAPLTDGGEGFCGILTRAGRGRFESQVVRGPLGEEIDARLGYVSAAVLSDRTREIAELPATGEIALVEMAAAAGLEQVPPESRDPRQTSTRGVGELLARATADEAAAILLGVGGSATHDLGLGALGALGLRFLDESGEAIDEPRPAEWSRLVSLAGELSALPPLRIACDVENPLLGPRGAAAAFGPQKGLPAEEVENLDRETARVARLLAAHCGVGEEVLEVPGSGAAGGIACGLSIGCGARLIPGFSLTSSWLGLPEKLAEADVVLTGEGRFDATSLQGKGPGRIVEEADRAGKPAYLFAGSADPAAVREAETRFPALRILAFGRENLSLEENLRCGDQFFEHTLLKLIEEEEWTKS